MAQSKRRSPDDSTDSSPKRPRTEQTPPDGSASQIVAPAQDGTSQLEERIQVPWILPSISKSDHNCDERQAVSKYAQSLFNLSWDALRPVEQPFQFPLVRTPIYKAKGKDIAANDLHRPGVFFRTLFNKIKLQTGGSGASTVGSDTTYARDAFNRTFDAASDHDAVVASNSEANPILALDQDYRLDVTIQDGKTTTTAHLNILRKAAPEEDAPGYFIELPALGSVTINGRTFSNVPAEGTTSGTALPPLIFGPLLRFTTLELLSQPVFLFRSRRDMDFTTPIASNKANRLGDEEIARRDRNDGIDPQKVTIRWTTTSPPSNEPEVPGGGNEPELPGAEPSPKPQEIAYDDEWTTGSGEPIDNPGGYLASHFLRIMQQPEPRFITGVVVGINARQPIELGFSICTTVGDQGMILRLGRPLLLALAVKTSFVLLILQVTAEGAVTAHILDPESWTVSRSRRNFIVNRIRQLLRSTPWLDNLFTDGRLTEDRLINPVQFIPCAQTDQDLIAHVYTVLNAWALVMGLSPNPRFASGDETMSRLFCHDATRLIAELTGNDGLQWKKVLAFFRHWDFILEADALPPIDRRFDTTKLKLGPAYVDYVIKEDRDFNAWNQTLDFGMVAEAMGLTFSNGKGHDEIFSCETLTVDFKRDVIRPLAVAGLWDWNMTDEQLRAALAEHNATAQASQEGTSSGPDPPTRSSNTPNDHETNPGLIDNPCDYFKSAMTRLREQEAGMIAIDNATATQQLPTAIEDALQSIQAVVRALNTRLAAGHRIGLVNRTSAQPQDTAGGDHNMLLIPWNDENHTLLIVAQIWRQDNARISITACDTAPWMNKKDQRLQVHRDVVQILRDHGWLGGVTPPPNTYWSFAKAHANPEYAIIHTVLSAWCVSMGLKLNWSFQPETDFFLLAEDSMRFARSGLADWALVWSFLRCQQFVTGGPPPPHFQFASSIPHDTSDTIPQNNTNVAHVTAPSDGARDDLSAGVQWQDDDTFRSDDWDIEDLEVRLPALQTANLFQSSFNRDKLRAAYRPIRDEPRQSTADFPEDMTPCVYFRRTVASILSDPEVSKQLEALRSSNSTTTGHHVWLLDSEVSLSVASVTQAISIIEGFGGGFSTTTQDQIQRKIDFPDLLQSDDQDAIRFGRPMLVPINIASHLVLLLVQYDTTGKPQIAVFDSRPWIRNKKHRQRVADGAWSLVCVSRWWKHRFAAFPDDQKPSSVTWVASAQQLTGNECGYYTILNAWSLALGLRLNMNFLPLWNENGEFEVDVQNIIHLARLGFADWRLIYAFLRCYRFVHEGTVPESRRFTNSLRLPDEAAFLEYIKTTRAQEVRIWSMHESPAVNPERIFARNTVPVPSGRRHEQNFLSDAWDVVGITYAGDLAEIGRPTFDLTQTALQTQLRYHSELVEGRTVGQFRAGDFIAQLRGHFPDLRPVSHEQFVTLYQDFRLQPAYEDYFNGFLDMEYDFNLDEADAFWATMRNDAGLQHLLDHDFIPKRFNDIEEEHVNRSIAAVVQAIDQHQARKHRARSTHPFAGGFSLATTLYVSMGKMPGPEMLYDPNVYVSRPRRPWFLPLTVGGEELIERCFENVEPPPTDASGRSHTFLAVVQQYDYEDDGFFYQIHLLDSSPSVFERQRESLFQWIAHIAYSLKWPMQRNWYEGNPKSFENKVSTLRVARQRPGSNLCSLHTVFNAWILAMGLTPDPDCKFDNKLYGRMYTLMRRAVAGTLHWQELVSFFFAHGLTVERAVEHVPEDRRFGLTAFQGGDETILEAYIQHTYDADDEHLAEHDETECPYLSGNDVAWDYDNVSEQDTYNPKIPGEDEDLQEKESPVLLCDEEHELQDDSADGAVEYATELAGGYTEDDAVGDTDEDTAGDADEDAAGDTEEDTDTGGENQGG